MAIFNSYDYQRVNINKQHEHHEQSIDGHRPNGPSPGGGPVECAVQWRPLPSVDFGVTTLV